MNNAIHRSRLETESLVVGYAMSRLDRDYLTFRNCEKWNDAFRQAGTALDVPASSLKNLRDEFDPIHGNQRKGWHRRPLRPSRQRVLAELCEVSNSALMELVDRILLRDVDATMEAIDMLSTPTHVVHNVAERLRTGRLAEEYFLANSAQIVNLLSNEIIDLRNAAAGFDFGILDQPEIAIEVKGMKQKRGDILFTDREWSEAIRRRDRYWLVVIGNISDKPHPRVILNPSSILDAKCQYQTMISAAWRSTVDVAG